MSNTEAPETKKSELFANWKEQPIEIKIMDLSTIAWLAIAIIEIIFLIASVELNERILPAVLLPIFMIIVTISLRLRLQEKPETIRNTFITWTVLFAVYIIASILILVLYPPLILR